MTFLSTSRVSCVAAAAAAIGFALTPALSAGSRSAAAEPAAATPVPVPEPTELPWVLLEAGPDGRSVVVTPRAKLPRCSTLRAELIDKTPRRVRLRVLAVSVDPRPGAEACAGQTDEPVRPIPTKVDLGVRLKGQKITGPGMVSTVFQEEWWSEVTNDDQPEKGHKAPRLVGLQAAQAMPILKSLGVASNRVTIVGARPGYIVSQERAARARLAVKNPRMTIRTTRLPSS